MATIKSNIYRVAGEQFAIETLKEIDATLEKKADLQLFQVDMMLNLVTESLAPIILAAADASLLWVYLPLKKILENMRSNLQRAQQEHEQNEYAYGFPAVPEEDERPEAFDFRY